MQTPDGLWAGWRSSAGAGTLVEGPGDEAFRLQPAPCLGQDLDDFEVLTVAVLPDFEQPVAPVPGAMRRSAPGAQVRWPASTTDAPGRTITSRTRRNAVVLMTAGAGGRLVQ